MQSKEWNIYRIIPHFIFRSWSRTNTYLYPPHSATDCHLVYRHNIPFVGLSDTFHSFSQCVPGTLWVRQKSIAWKFLRKPDIFQVRGKWMKLCGQWCKLVLWIINGRSLVTVLLLLWQLSEGKCSIYLIYPIRDSFTSVVVCSQHGQINCFHDKGYRCKWQWR